MFPIETYVSMPRYFPQLSPTVAHLCKALNLEMCALVLMKFYGTFCSKNIALMFVDVARQVVFGSMRYSLLTAPLRQQAVRSKSGRCSDP